MARIRSIKPAFFKHGELYDAEAESGLPLRIAYAGLWTIADREGRFKWRPRDIKTDVLPYDNVSMEAVLDALEARAFIQSYVIDRQKYGWIPAFKEHQHVNVREPASTIPEPPKNKSARAKRVPEPDRNGEEGKGREGKEILFDRFWKAYPRRESRGSALKAFEKACEKSAPETIITAASAYAGKRAGQDKQYTKLPATWLNQECWLDDGIAPSTPADDAAKAQAETAWEGRAAPLVAEIGAAKFIAWFGDATFDPGPPAIITLPKQFQRNWIATNYEAQLRRAFGEFDLRFAA